jgi:hypothetical protein
LRGTVAFQVRWRLAVVAFATAIAGDDPAARAGTNAGRLVKVWTVVDGPGPEARKSEAKAPSVSTSRTMPTRTSRPRTNSRRPAVEKYASTRERVVGGGLFPRGRPIAPPK